MRDVEEHQGIRVGARFRITQRWADRLADVGCASRYIAARRVGGVVAQITVASGYASIDILLDEPPVYPHGEIGDRLVSYAPEVLEPVPGETDQ